MKVARASALTLVLLTLLVAAAACGGGGGSMDTAEARAVVHWRAGLVRWNRQMIAALNGLSVLFSQPGPVTRLAASDPGTGARFASLDGTLADCSARVSALGPAPPGLEVARTARTARLHEPRTRSAPRQGRRVVPAARARVDRARPGDRAAQHRPERAERGGDRPPELVSLTLSIVA